MKIAIFNDNFYPEISGISDSIIDAAKEFVKMGHSVDFYVPYYAKKDFQVANLLPEELCLGDKIKIHRFFSVKYPLPTKQGRMVIPTFLRWVSMKKNKPDIIHTNLFFGAGMEAIVASKFLKIPLVGTNHTPISEFIKYGPVRGPLIDKYAKRLVSWFYNRCIFVSAPNKAILKEMTANKFKKPCEAISNPIDIQNFFPVADDEKEKIKERFGLSGFVVLYTGRLAPDKHVDVLVRAIAEAKKKIPDIIFAITGHGTAEKELKDLAKELGIENNVKFFGTVDVESHALIYKAADVFAIASTSEMQSLSMMKAMATGLPVIGVNAWALPEYIDEKNGFVLEVGDYQGIAEKIVFIFNNPQQGKLLGQGGLETARKFSPEKIAKRWIEIYEKVLADYNKK
jgi:1,2-diacylglycerol 3-alpha-glucosyltransferase